MSATIRVITEADVEYLFALDEIKKISQFKDVYLGRPEDFVKQGRHVAIDESTGNFVTQTSSGDRMDLTHRWLLVWEGKIILSHKSFLSMFYAVDYISAALIHRLGEITPFIRDALAIGGEYLTGIDAASEDDRWRAAQMEFALETAGDRGCNMSDLNMRIRHAAIKGNVDEVAQCLKDGALVNEKGIYRWRPLMWAASNGYADICNLLIEHGADVNVKESSGGSPLLQAAAHGHEDICRLLLEHGADVNERDSEGSSPLLNAVCRGHADICRLLIEGGAKVDEKNNNGGFPLLFASGEGLADICRLLVERGADVNERAESGVIALTSAISKGHTDICKYLLIQGADVSLAIWRNQNAFEIASDKDHHGCIAALVAWQSFSITTGYTPGSPALPWIRQKLDTVMLGGSDKAELSLSLMDEAGDWEQVMVMGAMYAESLLERSGVQG